jgi:hypothetical protein
VLGADAAGFAGGDVGAAVLDTVAGAEYAPGIGIGIGMGMGVGSGSLLAGFHDSVGSSCVAAGGGAAIALVPSVVLVLALVLLVLALVLLVLPVPALVLLVASVVPLVASVVPLAAAPELPAPPFVLLVVVAAGGGEMVSMVAGAFGIGTAAAVVVVAVTGLLAGAAPVDDGNISASMA